MVDQQDKPEGYQRVRFTCGAWAFTARGVGCQDALRRQAYAAAYGYCDRNPYRDFTMELLFQYGRLGVNVQLS